MEKNINDRRDGRRERIKERKRKEKIRMEHMRMDDRCETNVGREKINKGRRKDEEEMRE